jgi:alpha-1,4-digalacturonate transport system permease protein
MSAVTKFLFRRRGGKGWHWTDIVTWVWLIGGLFIMFGPAVWLVGSSFKTPAALAEFPPSILPYVTAQAKVEGYDKPLPLFDVTMDDGSVRRLAEVRRIGLVGQMVDPVALGEIIKADIKKRQPVREIGFATENYTQPFLHFDFLLYLRNSVFVTVAATLITLVVNSMAAFALSKYKFRGQTAVMLVILATLMVPCR